MADNANNYIYYIEGALAPLAPPSAATDCNFNSCALGWPRQPTTLRNAWPFGYCAHKMAKGQQLFLTLPLTVPTIIIIMTYIPGVTTVQCSGEETCCAPTQVQ